MVSAFVFRQREMAWTRSQRRRHGDETGDGGMDQNAEQVVNLLIQKKWHISFAESCTGGLAAAALVDVPNASLVLDVSFVTYASEAKVRVLGVRQETIDRFTVVSGPVAREMAAGAARVGGLFTGRSTHLVARRAEAEGGNRSAADHLHTRNLVRTAGETPERPGRFPLAAHRIHPAQSAGLGAVRPAKNPRLRHPEVVQKARTLTTLRVIIVV